MINKDLASLVLAKRFCFPNIKLPKGNSQSVARQLDVALMRNGFKLSNKLLSYIGGISPNNVFDVSCVIIDTCKKLIGGHVKHNVYFKDFPKNVPDTMSFWMELLVEYYEETGNVTDNLLEFSKYGRYLHTYEEMLESHEKFHPKDPNKNLKIISLGKDLDEELKNIYSYLAASTVPLNPEDRAVVELLCKEGYTTDSPIIIKENLAIINSCLISNRKPFSVYSPTDILRLAIQLSGGDCTLTTKSKIKSLSREKRKSLLNALENVLSNRGAALFVDEVNARREEFKRLCEKLHPFERSKAYPKTRILFHFAQRDKKDKKAKGLQTTAQIVNEAIKIGEITEAVKQLEIRPGLFVRNVDRLLRNCNNSQESKIVIRSFSKAAKQTSGRVLLSLADHLYNRKATAARIFSNKKGTSYTIPNELPKIVNPVRDEMLDMIWESIDNRIGTFDNLYISPEIEQVALPISDKTKSAGFNILPRGSIFELSETDPLVRFFIYWKENGYRTDYDLSALSFNSEFTMLNQVSWTSLRNGLGVHSGDITSAPNGASEFIEINLEKIAKEVRYLIPQVNKFAGNNFNECKECFFGFMERNKFEKGAPYEPTKVKTKFSLTGDKGVALPLVFIRVTSGGNKWIVKWLDIYMNGQISGNATENNRFSTALLTKSFIDKDYLNLSNLVDLYKAKAKKIVKKIDPKVPITYIGLTRPEDIHPDSKIYTLDNLKELIPA